MSKENRANNLGAYSRVVSCEVADDQGKTACAVERGRDWEASERDQK